MNRKELCLQLAAAIKKGIGLHQETIAKHQAKESTGLGKLAKTIGGAPVNQTGAGTQISAGSGVTEVPNLMRGVLPEGGGQGVPGGVGDMTTNADAGFGKAALTISGCNGCGGRLEALGVLGGLSHMLCSGCGSMTSTPVQENTEAKMGGDPTVAKGELKEVPDYKLVQEKKSPGAKDGSEPIPEATKTDGSGDITKGKMAKATIPMVGTKPRLSNALKNAVAKYNTNRNANTAAVNVHQNDGVLSVNKSPSTIPAVKIAPMGKGALTDRVQLAAAKAGVNSKEIGINSFPKKPESVKPYPNPTFHKPVAKAAMAPGVAIDGKPREKGIPAHNTLPGRNVQRKAKANNTRAEYEASKVEKGEYDGEKTLPSGRYGKKKVLGCTCTDNSTCRECLRQSQFLDWSKYNHNPPPMNTGSKVEKAESPASKPATKSPSSGPASKVAAPKMAKPVKTVSSL